MEDEYVTFGIAGQTFGAQVNKVRYVYPPSAITVVPLAPPSIAGLLNLRGRVVTAVDLGAFLGLASATRSGKCNGMAIGVEQRCQSYALLVDRVGEVISLAGEPLETNPSNLNPDWAEVSKGIHRTGEGLIVVVDIDRVLSRLGDVAETA